MFSQCGGWLCELIARRPALELQTLLVSKLQELARVFYCRLHARDLQQ
jgi:hypothetical protein